MKAKLSGMEKQVKHATVVALNRAAFSGMMAVKKEIGQVFNGPTPWIRNSVRYTKATKSARLVGGVSIGGASVMTATIDFDAWGNKQGVTAAHILNAEIYGGKRRNKRHEVALQKAGILPAGMGIVPGDAAVLDQYGNMSAGQIVQIMSWFQAFGEQGYRSNMRDGGKRLARDNKKTGAKGFAYFALQKPHGKLLPGVYQRFDFGKLGSAVKPVMIFVRMPSYKRRLDFYGIAARVAQAEFDKEYPIALAEAMRTAR